MTDYQTYWKTEEAIFLRPVAAAELFVPAAVKPRLDRLLLFCGQDQALVVVTGEAGTGKSTLARWLFEKVDPETHELLLTSVVRREVEAGWLTPRIAQLMGVKATSNQADLLRATAARLDELIAERRKLVVVVDAAHLAATPEALSEIVSLLNLQSLAETCLSFVLIGDASLRENVEATPSLAAKLAFSMALPKLSRAETEAYVELRLKQAGLATPFDSEAFDLIHTQSRGVIAQINSLAENCLVEAFQRQGRRVTADVARAASAHLALGGVASMQEFRAAAGEPAARPTPPRRADLPPPPVKAAPSDKAGGKGDSPSIKLSSLFKSKP